MLFSIVRQHDARHWERTHGTTENAEKFSVLSKGFKRDKQKNHLPYPCISFLVTAWLIRNVYDLVVENEIIIELKALGTLHRIKSLTF
jgi:hypothetical protein